jgi:hypothetical protein
MKFADGFFADNTFTPWFFTWPVETEAAPQESTVGGRSSRRSRDTDDDLIRQVLDKWETIERVRALDAPIVEPPPVEIRPEPATEEPDAVLAESFSPQVMAIIDSPAPFSPDKAAAALAARRRNDEEALILMLLEL